MRNNYDLRMLKFAHKCIWSESSLVNDIVRRGIMIGPTDSVIGRNILNCLLRITLVMAILRIQHFSHVTFMNLLTQLKTIWLAYHYYANFYNVEMVPYAYQVITSVCRI